MRLAETAAMDEHQAASHSSPSPGRRADVLADGPAQEHARALHEQSIVIDCSGVIDTGPAHFARFRAGGVTAVNHTVTRPDADLGQALAEIQAASAWIAAHPDDVLTGLSVQDIRTAKRTGRQAVIFGPQDTRFLGRDLTRLDRFYRLGVRVLQLTYQYRNFVGDGCGETSPAGLSNFGRSLVKEMNRLGILVDLSHCSRPTALEAIEISDTPPVFSHAHPYTLTPHIRAKDDDLLKALAKRGGVVGVTGLSPFNARAHGLRPTLRDWIAHVNYLVELIGPDHVGLGLDFDEASTRESDAAEIAGYPELALNTFPFADRRVEHLSGTAEIGNATVALTLAGFDDDTIGKILGGNFLRVFSQAWTSQR